MTTISIVMPVWGAERFIEASVQSVLDQTFDDLELILVDDRSPDRSLALAQDLVRRRGDRRVKFIARDINGGVSAARNTGLDHATGEFVAFIDNDDRYAPEFLRQLVGEAQSDPKIDIVAARPTRVMLDGRLLKPAPVQGWPTTVTGREAARLSLQDRISCFPWDKLYRRKLFDRLRFPEGILFEDMVITTLLCLSADKVRLVPETSYLYYTRADSQTWKDLPPTIDLQRALAFLYSGMGGVASDHDMTMALLRRKFLMTLHLAARALLLHRGGSQAADTVAYCRQQISLSDIPRVLLQDRFLGLAALGFRLSPDLYGAIYRRYVAKTYGINALIT
jgi:glycosyltransferase involved in cell wall biosynthesis